MTKLFTFALFGLILNTAGASDLIREHPLGLEKDGEIIRSNPLGHYETEEGTYRKDSLGNWSNGERTFREDSLGRWESKDKIIRKTPLGYQIEDITHAENERND